MRRQVRGAGIIMALGAVSTIGACASAQTYRFEIVEQRTPTTIAVRLVDTASGEAVPGARIFALDRRFAAFRKHVPQVQRTRVALASDGRGSFLYGTEQLHAGDAIQLVAQVPGQFIDVEGSLTLPQ